MTGRAEFSTYQFFENGYHEEVCRFVEAERAVTIARSLINSLGGKLGTTQRVIVTDGGDCTVFEWKHDEGIVWPEELKGKPV